MIYKGSSHLNVIPFILYMVDVYKYMQAELVWYWAREYEDPKCPRVGLEQEEPSYKPSYI
jgi:hypothetical protein